MSDGAVYQRSVGNGRRSVYYLDEISRQWEHPWFVTGFYEQERWKIQIKPGFVNGEPVLAGSDEVDEDGGNKLLPLTDLPAIPLRKNIFEQPKSAPEFFKKLGVKDPPRLDVIPGVDGGVAVETEVLPEGDDEQARMLVQCVVFLTQPRATQKMVASIPGNLMLANLVEYTVMWDTSALDALGRIARIGIDKELPKPPAPDFMDLLSGTLQDDPFDHLPLATLYFVSPAGESATEGVEDVLAGPSPDATWELYVKHDVFWNLGYANKNLPPINIPSFQLDPATAAFVGRYSFAPAATLGATNALVSRALAAAFNNVSNRGRFWTV